MLQTNDLFYIDFGEVGKFHVELRHRYQVTTWISYLDTLLADSIIKVTPDGEAFWQKVGPINNANIRLTPGEMERLTLQVLMSEATTL